MTRCAALASLTLLAGCAHASPARPPADPAERQRVEFVACQGNALPAWLDDAALAEASRLDRWSAFGSDPNDSYRGATLSAQPALPPRPAASSAGGSRAEAILAERREFQKRCDLLRSAGRGLALPRP
jgi:hypothetical protein